MSHGLEVVMRLGSGGREARGEGRLGGAEGGGMGAPADSPLPPQGFCSWLTAIFRIK